MPCQSNIIMDVLLWWTEVSNIHYWLVMTRTNCTRILLQVDAFHIVKSTVSKNGKETQVTHGTLSFRYPLCDAWWSAPFTVVVWCRIKHIYTCERLADGWGTRATTRVGNALENNRVASGGCRGQTIPRRRKTLIIISDHKPQGRQGETTSAISQDGISIRISRTCSTAEDWRETERHKISSCITVVKPTG